MEDILIKAEQLPEWLREKQFKNQDLISIEDLIAKIEDLDAELEKTEEEFQDFKEYVESNYKELNCEELYG